MTEKHWHILGAGAIGCLWASWLEDRCTLLLKTEQNVRPEHKHSFVFTLEKAGVLKSYEIACSNTAQTLTIDNLLICTKAHHTQAAISQLTVNPRATIVLMQNGMGNMEMLKKKFPEASIFLASTTHGAYRKNKHHVIHAGDGATYLGFSKDNNLKSKITSREVAQSLSNAHEQVIVDPDIDKRLWIKLAINCAINPLSVLYQCKNGELLNDQEKIKHLHAICIEIDTLLHKKNIIENSQSCFDIVKQVARDTAENYSSMYQDINNKKLSEIDYIQGFLLSNAQTLKLPMPENESLYQEIKTIEGTFQTDIT